MKAARTGVSGCASLWLAVAKTGDRNTASSACAPISAVSEWAEEVMIQSG